MTGIWSYRPNQDNWLFIVDNRVEITITGDELIALARRYRISQREALAWIATRPSGPYERAA